MDSWRYSRSIWGAPTPDTMNLIPKIQGISIYKEDGYILKTHLKIRLVKVRIMIEVEVAWRRCLIPIAEIKLPEYDGEDFVLSNGHYDSWHVGIGGNATGNAVLLEMAHLLHKYRQKLKRPIKIARWPGHSTGRYAGSTWYCDNFAMDLYRGCNMNMNYDSPECKDATNYDLSTWMDKLEDFGRSSINEAIGKDAAGIRPVRAGDYSFNGIGIPLLYGLTSYILNKIIDARGWYHVGGCEGNPGWHTEHDDMMIADRSVMEADTKVYALAAFRLASSSLYPLNFSKTLSKSIELIGGNAKDTAAEFDFALLMSELRRLESDVQEFYKLLDTNKPSELQTRIANQSLENFARLIIVVFYTRSGRFNHDLALGVPLYPGLSSVRTLLQMKYGNNKFRFQKTQLLRSRNKVQSSINYRASQTSNPTSDRRHKTDKLAELGTNAFALKSRSRERPF
jgi:N-acetylated-alpha-linked acidic dipeptidase